MNPMGTGPFLPWEGRHGARREGWRLERSVLLLSGIPGAAEGRDLEGSRITAAGALEQVAPSARALGLHFTCREGVTKTCPGQCPGLVLPPWGRENEKKLPQDLPPGVPSTASPGASRDSQRLLLPCGSSPQLGVVALGRDEHGLLPPWSFHPHPPSLL